MESSKTLGLARFRFAFAVFACSAGAPLGFGAPQTEPIERHASKPRPLFPRPVPSRPTSGESASEIIVKFKEGSGIRFEEGQPFSRTGSPIGRLAQVTRAIAADVTAVFDRPERELLAEKAAGESEGGVELADLTLFYRVRLAALVEPVQALSRLLALEDVETAYFAPLPPPSPTDLAPATPSFTASQAFQGPAPAGVDALYAWSQPGGRGTGVRVCDVEYNWYATHEEFNDLGLTVVGATPMVPPGLNVHNETSHGTAALGVVAADENGYGVRGIAWQSLLSFAGAFTQAGGYNVANAINLASGALAPGDVILIEQQAFGPNGNAFVPVEWNAAEFAAIANATANGRIVVEAAANGSENLDNLAVYGQAFQRAFRDSGAILVAAADAAGNPLPFTDFGSRIDAWALGSNVPSAGYGDLFWPLVNGVPDNNQCYTATRFGGTSSASAIVAGCAASLQGVSRHSLGVTMSPLALRSMLVSTGTPQAPSGQMIGTQPDLRAAIASIVQSVVMTAFYGQVSNGCDLPCSANPISAQGIVTPDLDNDGAPDIVISRTDPNSGRAFVESFRNQGGGAFQSASGQINLSSNFSALSIAQGDFNRDGNLDVAVSSSGTPGSVTLLLGNGAGGFSVQNAIPLVGSGFGLDAADLNRDGNLDLAVAQTGGVTVLLGNGAGGMSATRYPFPGSNWVALETADFDRDSFVDFAVTGPGATDILINNGNGAPQGGSSQASVPGDSLVAGDLDQDSIPDLAIVDSSASPAAMTVLRWVGAGQPPLVATTVLLPSLLQFPEVKLLDVNGDLLLDAAISGVLRNSNTGFDLLLGDGRLGFGPVTPVATGGFPGYLGAADFDADGAVDFASPAIMGPLSGVVVNRNTTVQRRMTCRGGNVNEAAGVAADVLRANGQSGDVDRIVRMAPQAALTMTMSAPSGGPVSARFALYVVRRRLADSDATPQPFGLGTACFPTPLSGGTLPTTLVLANNLGFNGQLGTPIRNVPPAPSTVVRVNQGFAAGTVLSFQGFIQDRNAALRGASITNFIEVQVR